MNCYGTNCEDKNVMGRIIWVKPLCPTKKESIISVKQHLSYRFRGMFVYFVRMSDTFFGKFSSDSRKYGTILTTATQPKKEMSKSFIYQNVYQNVNF